MRKFAFILFLIVAAAAALKASIELTGFSCNPANCLDFEYVEQGEIGSVRVEITGTCAQTVPPIAPFPDAHAEMNLWSFRCTSDIGLDARGNENTTYDYVYVEASGYETEFGEALWYGWRRAFCNGGNDESIPPPTNC